MLNLIVPIITAIILIIGKIKGRGVMSDFADGANDGIKTVIRILPTLIIVISATSFFMKSGAVELLSRALSPICNIIKMPAELLPLAILRPFSGGGSIAYMSDLISQYGADSNIGLMAAIMTTSTETTFYIVSVYTQGRRVKGMWKIITAALTADAAAVIFSVMAVNNFFA